MKILITGNMGYVGPGVVAQLRAVLPDAKLIGFDMAYFGSCLTNAAILPERKLDVQLFGDIRNLPAELLQGVDAVVHLAAISNDPMGSRFEDITLDVNYRSSVRLAEMAKDAGVRSFVFASSCSMYGAAEGAPKTEDSTLNPLTAYARSKVFTEADIKPLADENFTVTCLRFATACGMSDRLRLDLVLNDFVACAVSAGHISILSDGSPWRPLIHVKDMALAIEWAVNRDSKNGGQYLAVNAGSNSWNYQVHQLATAVAKEISGTQITLYTDAPPDKRSYCVNFDLFAKLAPAHQPRYKLEGTIKELAEGLNAVNFTDSDFRNSKMMRLKVLTGLQDTCLINDDLEWTDKVAYIAERSSPFETV
ncbi:SDR family oxidoreductase [Mucilaginibacter sp. 21P]|uniref:NAD-dependent epimerase/dehydratase family protein n=1 Tax=Mucilaginibacter sp. 21P TaxID=2778902 RepID=UPI001C5A028D|nr:SDR family oxidoreductase [Mucilaginibacter sp. 21P]QXV64845.1 SDR family oxidoreductase [Mucilaginibacter sp. 21P]